MCDAPISADNGGHWVVVCSREQLAARRIVCASVAGLGILIIQDGEAVVACARACPHEQADLSHGHVAEGRLHCPHHRASFSLATGVISPGWSSRPLRRFRVRIDDTDVWVDTDSRAELR
jgi:3-phenylpropionate/trans-cinnamate dioxygenase ferredoxin subunit